MEPDESNNFILTATEEKTFEEVVLPTLPKIALPLEKSEVNETKGRSPIIIDNFGLRKEVDITNLLWLPQKDAAKILGIPNSTLCKRWKEQHKTRRWPAPTINKISKEIHSILLAQSEGHEILPEEAPFRDFDKKSCKTHGSCIHSHINNNKHLFILYSFTILFNFPCSVIVETSASNLGVK